MKLSKFKCQLTVACALVLVGITTTLATEATDPAVKSAKNAWLELVGEEFAKRPPFSFVEQKPMLANVLIYGDSISIHYTQRVRETLAAKANVYRLYRNGGESQTFIPKMNKMHDTMRNLSLTGHWDFDWDVIHFNVGLHDLKYIKDGKLDISNGTQVTTIAEYKHNLREIVLYLKKHAPSAELIFATTTPVPEGAAGRVAGDARKYNEAALLVLKDFPEVSVNDLYHFTKPVHSKWWLAPGDVHYNKTGQNAQGDEVARAILSRKIFN